MKIAIASVDKNEDSEISSRGGRAPYYLIFDEKGQFKEAVSNPFTVGGGGAGPSVSKMLADMNVNIFIAGAVGEKMKDALEDRGLTYYEKEGNIKDALDHFLKNK